jgi:pimeloyl-ACP methyl ester carboxylesterase
MFRRQFIAAAAAFATVLFAGACSAQDAGSFVSDRITVVAEGSGPDVVLIPGLTSSPTAWRGTTPHVPGYRYHYVQVTGFAGTAAEANATGKVAEPVAAEIARYIREQKLARPAVIGHSMGGTMAMMIAARHPDLVSKLMVVDQLPFMGSIYGPPGTTAQSVKPTADGILAQMNAATPEARIRNLERMTALMVQNKEQAAIVLKEAKASDRNTSANAFHELIVTDLTPELSAIRVPVTVLYVKPPGLPYTDEQFDGFYKAAYAPLKQVKLARVPDSAHFIMSDNPAFFQAEMKAFLAR